MASPTASGTAWQVLDETLAAAAIVSMCVSSPRVPCHDMHRLHSCPDSRPILTTSLNASCARPWFGILHRNACPVWGFVVTVCKRGMFVHEQHDNSLGAMAQRQHPSGPLQGPPPLAHCWIERLCSCLENELFACPGQCCTGRHLHHRRSPHAAEHHQGQLSCCSPAVRRNKLPLACPNTPRSSTSERTHPRGRGQWGQAARTDGATGFDVKRVDTGFGGRGWLC